MHLSTCEKWFIYMWKYEHNWLSDAHNSPERAKPKLPWATRVPCDRGNSALATEKFILSWQNRHLWISTWDGFLMQTTETHFQLPCRHCVSTSAISFIPSACYIRFYNICYKSIHYNTHLTAAGKQNNCMTTDGKWYHLVMLNVTGSFRRSSKTM